MLTAEQVEHLAILAHETYLRSPADVSRDEPARCPWEELDEAHRSQNRDQVELLLDWLEQHGYVVGPLGEGQPLTDLGFEKELDEYGRYEHARWMQLRVEQGYQYGERRNDRLTAEHPTRTHPDLVPWTELSLDAKDKDEAPLRYLLNHLARLGLTVVVASSESSDNSVGS